MPKKTSSKYLGKLENEIQSNQSKVSMILGALIILVVGILVFNFFNKNKATLGPAQQTESPSTQQDVSKDKLPGKYTVKEGDTLFVIAEKYYSDGYKYNEIAKANNLENAEQIEIGQSLEIPKLETQEAQVTSPSPEPTQVAQEQQPETATGGGDTTIWGPRIEGKTYTVVEGDWLSKIAGRAYGDIMAFEKIAKANNITDPNLIEPGMVLTIPR